MLTFRRRTVSIAYMSLDEVNQDLALEIADGCGERLATLASSAEVLPGECDAIVYDLDHLCASDRRLILEQLMLGPTERLAAVHSYHLPPRAVRSLRRNGVIVERRLQGDWLARLIDNTMDRVVA
jgi:hypothetical protein